MQRINVKLETKEGEVNYSWQYFLVTYQGLFFFFSLMDMCREGKQILYNYFTKETGFLKKRLGEWITP